MCLRDRIDPVVVLAGVGDVPSGHGQVLVVRGLIEHDLEVDDDVDLSARKSGVYVRRISVEDNGKRFGDFDHEAGPVLDYLKDIWASA